MEMMDGRLGKIEKVEENRGCMGILGVHLVLSGHFFISPKFSICFITLRCLYSFKSRR